MELQADRIRRVLWVAIDYRRTAGESAEPLINEVLDVMVELARDGMTMMVVTHEMGFAKKVANRVIFMDEGKILEDLPKDEFFKCPKDDRTKEFLSRILSH